MHNLALVAFIVIAILEIVFLSIFHQGWRGRLILSRAFHIWWIVALAIECVWTALMFVGLTEAPFVLRLVTLILTLGINIFLRLRRFRSLGAALDDNDWPAAIRNRLVTVAEFLVVFGLTVATVTAYAQALSNI